MLLLGGLLVAFISFDFIHTEVSSNGAAGASEDGRIDNVHEKETCSQSELNCPSPDGKDSVYGPRSDCSQFCQCSNGVPYLHNCPSGLHFNPVLNVCDWPERAGCVNNSDNENNGGDSTDGGDAVDEGEGNAGGDNGSGDGGDGNEEKDKVQLCSQSELNCPSPDGKDSVYGPRSDCSQFCQCSNGVAYLHNCPSGLHFNPDLNVCDWPESAGCLHTVNP